jgi:hypothetical protein
MNGGSLLLPALLVCACGAESQAQRNDGTYVTLNSRGSLNGNAQALVQKALNELGNSFGL